jgi:hypothetical protein
MRVVGKLFAVWLAALPTPGLGQLAPQTGQKNLHFLTADTLEEQQIKYLSRLWVDTSPNMSPCDGVWWKVGQKTSYCVGINPDLSKNDKSAFLGYLTLRPRWIDFGRSGNAPDNRSGSPGGVPAGHAEVLIKKNRLGIALNSTNQPGYQGLGRVSTSELYALSQCKPELLKLLSQQKGAHFEFRDKHGLLSLPGRDNGNLCGVYDQSWMPRSGPQPQVLPRPPVYKIGLPIVNDRRISATGSADLCYDNMTGNSILTHELYLYLPYDSNKMRPSDISPDSRIVLEKFKWQISASADIVKSTGDKAFDNTRIGAFIVPSSQWLNEKNQRRRPFLPYGSQSEWLHLTWPMFFASKEHVLKADARLQACRIAFYLQDRGFSEILIVGRTDSSGEDDRNQDLGKNRAIVVRDAISKIIGDLPKYPALSDVIFHTVWDTPDDTPHGKAPVDPLDRRVDVYARIPR